MRLLLLSSAVLVGGCLVSPEALVQLRAEADAENARAHERVLAELSALPAVATREIPLDEGWKRVSNAAGIEDDERLYRRADGAFAWASRRCEGRDACGGCVQAIEYRFVSRGSAGVITRVVPSIHTRHVKVATCGIGCGVAPPPEPPWTPTTATFLGVLAGVEISDARYLVEELEETCDHPVPAP